MPFSDELQRIMAERGVTQSELARRVGVSSQAVNQWIGGGSVPRGGRLNEIAEALNVMPGDLVPPPPSLLNDEGIRVRLRDAMRRRDLAEAELAKSAGITPNQMRALLSGAIVGDDLRRRAGRLAQPLGTTPTYLMFGDYLPKRSGEEEFKVFRDSGTELSEESIKRLPVWKTSEVGPDGKMNLQMGDPFLAADWIVRPRIVERVRDAFAFYVIGSAMEPRWMAGELAIVNPSRPIRSGDPILISLANNDDEQAKPALFRRLVSQTSKGLVVEQINSSKRLDIPDAEVSQVWRVHEWGELISG